MQVDRTSLAQVTVWENQYNLSFGTGVKAKDHKYVRNVIQVTLFISD